jgi:HD-like signal output (HDOD) protein
LPWRADKGFVPSLSETISSQGSPAIAAATQDVLRRNALRSLSALPPFSPTLNRLVAALAQEDVSFTGLGDLIEKDTVLAGNILRLVNSALYARSGTINSVRHALSLLGITKLRNAVLGMSLSRMWIRVRTPPTWSMARFNMHSSATAILSDLLAQRLPVCYPEGALVAGLLHDVGRLLIAIGLPDEYSVVSALIEKQSADPGMHDATGGDSRRGSAQCEQQILGFTHAELSADALAAWKLPEPIQVAVRYHHQPDADPSVTEPGRFALSRIVDAANQYVNSTGISILAQERRPVLETAPIERLGMGRESVDRLLSDFEAEYKTAAQFFN